MRILAFDTSNAGIAEGLIGTAIAASILKRYLARMTQALRGVEVSTRKVACVRVMDWVMCSVCLLVEGVVAFFPCYEAWWTLWRTMLFGPIRNETAKGRLQFGSEPVL